MNSHNTQNSFIRAIKKFFLSAFVVVSFIGYALHNRSAYATGAVGQAVPTPSGSNPTQTIDPNANNGVQAPAQTGNSQPTAQPASPTDTAVPTETAQAAAPSTSGQTAQNGQYKDGTYTGPEVDVNWGLVQVQAVIHKGKISNVSFLEYPSDRRTSQRINSFAVPTLQQEAVQAQSANVNMITGATLTSEGFQMSLQDALNQAKAQ